jgi:hypothetical protein
MHNAVTHTVANCGMFVYRCVACRVQQPVSCYLLAVCGSHRNGVFVQYCAVMRLQSCSGYVALYSIACFVQFVESLH